MQLASSFGMKGLRADTADDLDGVIDEMIATDGLFADIRVEEETVSP